ILDEVINGMGRTGKWFAYEHYGLQPDMVTVAKGLTSGYQPLGAVMTTEEVFQAFLGEPGEGREAVQLNTWGGHAAACAAGLKVLEIMETENLPARAAEVGDHLLSGLETLRELPLVGDVRGKGLVAAVELVSDKETKTPLDGQRMGAVVRGCKERGIIVGRSGGVGAGLGNSITMAPPLVLTTAEADRIVDTLREVIGGLEKPAKTPSPAVPGTSSYRGARGGAWPTAWRCARTSRTRWVREQPGRQRSWRRWCCSPNPPDLLLPLHRHARPPAGSCKCRWRPWWRRRRPG